MRKLKCTIKNCPNDRITFSEKCGLHTSNRKIVSALKNYKRNIFKKIILSDVDIAELNFENKTFSNCQFTNIAFINIHFSNCIFKDCYLSGVHFSDSKFIEFSFLNCDFLNCEIEACLFENAKLFKDTFIECSAYENTEFNKSLLDGVMFIGSTIDDKCRFSEVKFVGTRVSQSSISDSEFSKTYWLGCEFTDTILYNNNFTSSEIMSLTHDFGQGSFPKLNDFSNTKIIETTLPKTMRDWNLFKGGQERFLLRIVERISKEKHPNNLSILTKVLEKIDDAGYVLTVYFIRDINAIFKRQFESAASNADYRTVGEVISEYGRIPSKYKITGFALPAPKNKQIIQEHEACLLLQFQMEQWTVQSVHQLFFYLHELTKLMPNSLTPISVSDILRGSIMATLWGDIKQLLITGRFLDIEKLEIEVENAHIERELKKIELERQRELQKSKEKEEAIRHKKAVLDIEIAELEIMHRKINLLNDIEDRFGIDFSEYAATDNGKKANQIASELRELFPVLNLKLKILDSKKEKDG